MKINIERRINVITIIAIALIAHYWHDYRGDEHGIEFIDGTKESWPVGRMIDFVEGGGPKPLTLSERAVEYLKQRQS